MAQNEHVIAYGSTTNSLLKQIDPSSLPDPAEICSICQTELQSPQDEENQADERVIVRATCGHHFCSECINGHLTYLQTRPGVVNFRCPICRDEWKIIWDPAGPTPPVAQREEIEPRFPMEEWEPLQFPMEEDPEILQMIWRNYIATLEELRLMHDGHHLMGI